MRIVAQPPRVTAGACRQGIGGVGEPAVAPPGRAGGSADDGGDRIGGRNLLHDQSVRSRGQAGITAGPNLGLATGGGQRQEQADGNLPGQEPWRDRGFLGRLPKPSFLFSVPQVTHYAIFARRGRFAIFVRNGTRFVVGALGLAGERFRPTGVGGFQASQIPLADENRFVDTPGTRA